MNIPRVVCECGKVMTCAKQGLTVEVMADFGSYYKIQADRYACSCCDAEVLTAFARGPIAEHWQKGYDEIRADAQIRF